MSLTEKIEAIRARVDVLRVVGGHVQLKKQGRSYVGRCPFHSEKSPSFSVSPDKGLYYCFGCHASGDIFKFVQELNGVDFRGAVQILAKQCGIEVEPETPEQQKRRKLETGIAYCNTFADAFFKHALWAKGGERARRYLEERGIPESQAHERGLGFGGEQGDLLRFLERKNVKPGLAAKAGLLNETGDRCLFDERLMFPIVDQHGRIAGFGGRWIGATNGADGERLRPKYVNTRESMLFS
ncbi:MAG: DNA primase, partial [Clostridia bacterium]|nr:DNA primase [Deltaproteobacteria bacterium]